MSYASALRGKSPSKKELTTDSGVETSSAAAAVSSKPKKDKGDRKSKKEKRSGIAPIDADEQDDETVRALRDKMAALHSQIAALEQKRNTTTTAGGGADVVVSPVSGDLLSSQASSNTLVGGSSILTHVGLDGGSDGRFLAPSSGHLLGAGSDETLAVHSDEDDGYSELVSASARYMTNSAADVPLNQQQRRVTSSPKPNNNMTVGSTPNTIMNPAAPSFTPNVAAAAFVPGTSSSAPSTNNNNHNNGLRNHANNHYRPPRGGYEASSANPPTSTSRPSGNAGTTVTTMSVDPDADSDREPMKSMSYNKNHHHDVVRDLMMLMKQQLALSKVRLGSSNNVNDGIAERRLESGMTTRPGFAQFSKSSAELQEQHHVTVQDEQRANAAAMVRSVLGEGAGSDSLSVSHTPDGKVHLTERLRSLADNPEEAARLLASLTEMEANEIAKEVFSPPTTKDYVVVEYKRERTKKFPCDIPVSPGDYVIVDGDRGTDCGLVVQVAKARPNHTYEVECMSSMVKNNVRKKMERGRVIRQATTDEIFSLHNEIAEVEKDALHLCRNKCIEHNIEVDLVDCEVQFDRKKVSFFFNSPIAVDFRALVRDLYNTFHIRIWMENVSPRVRNIEPFQVGGSSHNVEGNSGNNNRDSFSVGTNPGYRGGRGGRGGGNSDHPARSFTGRGAGHSHIPHHNHQQQHGGHSHQQGGHNNYQQQGGYDGYGQGAAMYSGGRRGGGGGGPRYNQPPQNNWGGQGQHDGSGASGFPLPNY